MSQIPLTPGLHRERISLLRESRWEVVYSDGLKNKKDIVRWVSLAVGVLIIAVEIFLTRNMVYTRTPSLNYTFFWIGCDRAIGQGNYVMFQADERMDAVEEGEGLIKRIVCVQGEYLTTRGREHFCNGKYIDRAKEKSLTGRSLEFFSYNGPVPPGKVYVLGDSKDSYDSRYWGFLDVKNITNCISPIF